MSDADVLAYLPKVRYVAHAFHRKVRWSGIEFDDLFQSGCIGLLLASKTFDSAHDVKFWSFAQIRVVGAIVDYLRSLDIVPRKRRDKIDRGEAPGVSMIPLEDTHAVYRGDTAMAQAFERAKLLEFVRRLPALPQTVIQKRLEGTHQREIAREMNHCQAWVSGVEQTGVKLLRHMYAA